MRRSGENRFDLRSKVGGKQPISFVENYMASTVGNQRKVPR